MTVVKPSLKHEFVLNLARLDERGQSLDCLYLKGWVRTPPDLSPRFTCKVNLSNIKLAATEDYRVFHKIIFGAVLLSIVSQTELLERL